MLLRRKCFPSYSYTCLCSSFSCSLGLCSHRSLKLYGQTDVFSKIFGEKSCIIIHLKKFHFLHGFLHFCYYCYWLWLHISASFLNQYLLQCFKGVIFTAQINCKMIKNYFPWGFCNKLQSKSCQAPFQLQLWNGNYQLSWLINRCQVPFLKKIVILTQ